MSRKHKLFTAIVAISVLGFLVLQILPVGRFRSVLQRNPNPAVATNIDWDSTATEHLVKTACFDCHSNETVYPWYAHVAPVSWLVTRDVNKGRAAMNFSENAESEYDLKDLEWHLTNDMPPRIYLVMHPEAKLTDEQREALLAGFKATFPNASQEGMEMEGG